MHYKNDNKSVRTTIWFSSIIRWVLGAFFIGVGIWYIDRDGWPAILFGAVMIITGFLRPKRCLNESCELPSSKEIK